MIKLKDRVCVRLGLNEVSMLDELRGWRYMYEPSEIIRQAIRSLHAQYVTEKMNPARVQLVKVLSDEPPVSDVPIDTSDNPPAEDVVRQPGPPSDEVEVKKETSPGSRKSTRRAPKPKPEDNHKPTKGAKSGKRSVQRRVRKGQTGSQGGKPSNPKRPRKAHHAPGGNAPP